MNKITAAMFIPIPIALMWLAFYIIRDVEFHKVWWVFPYYMTSYSLCVATTIIAIWLNVKIWID